MEGERKEAREGRKKERETNVGKKGRKRKRSGEGKIKGETGNKHEK